MSRLQIRLRDVVLKFTALDSESYSESSIEVRQVENDFPIGSCINRTNIDNEDFVDFFVTHFNWAMLGNELKWDWTEPKPGNVNYKDADDMLALCQKHNIKTREHGILCEVNGTYEQWVRSLSQLGHDELMKAVENRLAGLLTRYKGKFNHHDVNNEMMQSSFEVENLGKEATLFKKVHELDSSATLFVSDYNVEDGCKTRLYPEKYIQYVIDLQKQGAPVGGIGIPSHMDCPVGPIVSSALDKLGILGLPIWFTALDVSSTNEFVRADDLEVMMREAFTHPCVEGIMLGGFWEMMMRRKYSHLVNAEGVVNEAGKRLLALKHEWLSQCNGYADKDGVFGFRGFHGKYSVAVVTSSKKIFKTIVVDKGDSPLLISIDL